MQSMERPARWTGYTPLARQEVKGQPERIPGAAVPDQPTGYLGALGRRWPAVHLLSTQRAHRRQVNTRSESQTQRTQCLSRRLWFSCRWPPVACWLLPALADRPTDKRPSRANRLHRGGVRRAVDLPAVFALIWLRRSLKSISGFSITWPGLPALGASLREC